MDDDMSRFLETLWAASGGEGEGSPTGVASAAGALDGGGGGVSGARQSARPPRDCLPRCNTGSVLPALGALGLDGHSVCGTPPKLTVLPCAVQRGAGTIPSRSLGLQPTDGWVWNAS